MRKVYSVILKIMWLIITSLLYGLRTIDNGRKFRCDLYNYIRTLTRKCTALLACCLFCTNIVWHITTQRIIISAWHFIQFCICIHLPSVSQSAIHLPSVSQSHSFAFRWRKVRRLLLDLVSYCGTDSFGMFPHLLKRTADALFPRLNVVFHRLLRLGSFPVCWRLAYVTQIPKGPPSSSVANYRQIFIIFIVQGVWASGMQCRGVLPNTQFAYRKGRGSCDALLYSTHLTECFGEEAGG